MFASIRPDGAPGNIWVNAGKGFTASEAKIGAYMEALEYSFAENQGNGLQYHMARAQDVLDSFNHGIQFPEFAAWAGHQISEDDALAVMPGEELLHGLGTVLLPAELVLHPFRENPGKRLYGTSTNGLASGNTLEEATVHALAEVLERHVRSFEYADDQSHWTDLTDSTPKLRKMVELVERAGLRCALRYSANEFGMAYFSAYLLEPDERQPIAITRGHGFHPVREIAAIRALAEAVQSRLTCIHGGRDDVTHHVEVFERLGQSAAYRALRSRMDQVQSQARTMSYRNVPDHEDSVKSIEACKALMFQAMRAADLNYVVRVVYTEPDYPFQVVRVVVPGAESYKPDTPRIGPRLLACMKAKALRNKGSGAAATSPSSLSAS